MRTTVVLPPELLRAAKARSAERGESLKTLLTRAVEAELGRSSGSASARSRVSLPIFGEASGRPVPVTNADIERALATGDAAVTTPASRRRQRTRR